MKFLFTGAGILVLALLSALLAFALLTQAADDTAVPGSPQLGAVTVTQVCSGCHSLKYVSYSDLQDIGLSEEEAEQLAGDKDLNSTIERQIPEETAQQTYGVVPPDLSLMALAREGGSEYIFKMLTGFYQENGEIRNRVFPGIRMPDILGISAADTPQQVAEIRETALNAAAFLEWAASPHEEEMKRIGSWVIAYLVGLTILLYALKRVVWKDIK